MIANPGATLHSQPPALDALTIHRYRFALEVQPGPPLLTFESKGSALRGTLLRRLHARFCQQPFVRGVNACLPCHQPQTCPIAFLVNTKAADFDPDSARGDDLPRPFSIEPELSTRTSYPPGERFSFGVTLFGRANTLLPYLCGAVEAFDDHLSRSGEDGLRGRVKLAEVWAEQPLTGARELVWQPGQPLRLPNMGVSITDVAAACPPHATAVSILFKSPTTLKHQGQLVRTAPPFVTLTQRLLERIAGLLNVLGDDPPRLPFAEFTALARAVSIATPADAALSARWVDLDRYSSTHGYKHSIGGIVGRVRYVGDLGPFLPYLVLGQWLHIGKNAVQGNGIYVVEQVGD